MILNFKTHINHNPTSFVEKILSGEKVHTIREGNRWKKGDLIHMSTGARSKNYTQFNKNLKHLETVISVQEIKIRWVRGSKKDLNYDFFVFVDGCQIVGDKLMELIYNDGFSLAYDFGDWFNKDFTGQIIHWTNLKY